MDQTAIDVLISLGSGALGGRALGRFAKTKRFHPPVNTVLGAAGGGGVGVLMSACGVASALGPAGTIGISAIAGALLPLVVSYCRDRNMTS